MMAETKVEYNFLGKSGLKVSNIALGTMTFGKDDKSQVGYIFFSYVFLCAKYPVTGTVGAPVLRTIATIERNDYAC